LHGQLLLLLSEHLYSALSLNKIPNVLRESVRCVSTFALRSPKAIHLIPEEQGEIWRDLRWVGKVECWRTKAAISRGLLSDSSAFFNLVNACEICYGL